MKIGTHIKKSKEFYGSLKTFYDDPYNFGKPTQLFTGSPKSWRRPIINKSDVKKTRKYVTDNNLSVYIHSIYLINLSKSLEEFKEKAFECLTYELEIGTMLGFKGVVVHCGKSLKLSKEKALDNMYDNVMAIYNSGCISESNPLLIETSAGQGTEVCTTYDCFKSFYDRFTDKQKRKIKICIDTCHVFAAGHDSEKYLKDWDKDHPNSIVLVHYNDSKEECGKKKDRHAPPGEGYIGREKMDIIAKWCKLKILPMVIE